MIGIYKITSPTGAVYIGQSWNIEKRLAQYRNLSCKGQRRILNSLKKHGADFHLFKSVYQLPFDIDQNTLDAYETLFIHAYKCTGIDLMNLRDGGKGGKMSDETRKKMSISHTGTKSTIEARRKISLSNGLIKKFFTP